MEIEPTVTVRYGYAKGDDRSLFRLELTPQTFMSRCREFLSNNFEWLIALGAVIAFAFLVMAAHRESAAEKSKAYAAWCKQTENPKHLTFDEWDSLNEATRPRNDTTVIYTPIYH